MSLITKGGNTSHKNEQKSGYNNQEARHRLDIPAQ